MASRVPHERSECRELLPPKRGSLQCAASKIPTGAARLRDDTGMQNRPATARRFSWTLELGTRNSGYLELTLVTGPGSLVIPT
jgi:hypothetical protein